MHALFLFIFITVSLLLLASFTGTSNKRYNNEPFGDIGRRIHVKLNQKNCEPAYFSYQQPSGNGELGCTQVPCPEKSNFFPDGYPDRIVCWSCCNYR